MVKKELVWNFLMIFNSSEKKVKKVLEMREKNYMNISNK